MICPRCGDAFEEGVLVCPDDLVPLVEEGAPPEAVVPVADALLGRFAPEPGRLVVGMLQHRRHVHEVDEEADGTWAVWVDADVREALRAELVSKWPELLGALPPDERMALGRRGATSQRMPGWADPPSDAWVDWDGNLRVVDADEEAYDDATRIVGPSMAAIGVVLVVFGLYAGTGPGVLFLGLLLTGVGVFVPR